ncbi:MAG TPA: VWA domain-containing protein, partial [Roseiflexaceae bacterium]|nr:VWA domain-containing protein [Roseiflexaceae bacterium]
LEQNVQLQPGPNRFSLKVDAKGQGFQRFRAQIEPQTDVRTQNNQAEAIVRVGGAARILLIAGKTEDGQNFQNALKAAGVAAETIAPDAAPDDLTSLSEYEAVALINVPARELPVKLVANLPAYVRDLGKGLIMIGGERSYGVGGYSHTPVEEALPVYMDVRDRQERPDLALIFVIDKSGSMNACHCSGPNRQTSQSRQGGTPKIDIAKDAVIQASAVLGKRDTVGVVAFDESAHWALPATRGPSTDQVENAVAPIQPDGQTNVRVGLQSAEDTLQQTDAKIKHVILLTDGWSRGGDNLDIATRMRDEGITLSVVGAGGGSADYLKQLAETGGGRYYPTQNMEEVPQIFVQETITAVGNYLIEEPFTPKYAAGSAILEGLDAGVPKLYGYNGTTAKETATTVL